MNHFETNGKRSTFQILLLVIFIPLVAASGLAQVNEEAASTDDSQTLVQRKSRPLIDLERITLDFPGSTRTRENPFSSVKSVVQPDPDASKFAVFFDAGVTLPHGDISPFLDPSVSLNAGLEYMFTSQFSVEGTFGYHRFSTFFGGDANLYQVSGNGKFYFVDESSRVRPFINGGLGVYVTDSATAHFGGNIGGGILFEVTKKVGVQGRYNFHAFTAGSNTHFSSVQGGVRFRF